MTSHPFGVLNSYDSVQIRIYYSPTAVGVGQQIIKVYYTDKSAAEDLSFFLDAKYRQAYVLSIHTQAVAVHRGLSFSQSQLTLPNTMIGVPSRIQFFIYNIGYKNTTKLAVFFPPELSKVLLMVQFPWGN